MTNSINNLPTFTTLYLFFMNGFSSHRELYRNNFLFNKEHPPNYGMRSFTHNGVWCLVLLLYNISKKFGNIFRLNSTATAAAHQNIKSCVTQKTNQINVFHLHITITTMTLFFNKINNDFDYLCYGQVEPLQPLEPLDHPFLSVKSS